LNANIKISNEIEEYSSIEQEISNSRRKIKHFGIRHAAARFEKKLKLTALAIN